MQLALTTNAVAQLGPENVFLNIPKKSAAATAAQADPRGRLRDRSIVARLAAYTADPT